MTEYDDLERLAELLRKGVLTQEEFDQQKARLLSLPLPPQSQHAHAGAGTARSVPSKIGRVIKWYLLGSLGLAVLIAVGVAIGQAVRRTTTDSSAAPTSAQVKSAEPKAAPTVPGDCTGIACKMTRNSGIEDIPLPEDTTLDSSGPVDSYLTKVGTMSELASFYKSFLVSRGWLFLPEYSDLNPKTPSPGSKDLVSVGEYCIPTSPVKSIGIIIGNRNGDPKQGLSFSIIESDTEPSCP